MQMFFKTLEFSPESQHLESGMIAAGMHTFFPSIHTVDMSIQCRVTVTKGYLGPQEWTFLGTILVWAVFTLKHVIMPYSYY